jgi:signal transduction histidine kinase/ligand-binding sensor domain-containing protein
MALIGAASRSVTASALLASLVWALTARAADAGDVHRVTQYLHTSWRVEDGSAPAGALSMAQTSDGYIWLSAFTQELYRFDGVRFVARTVSVEGRVINPIVEIHADRAGRLWVLGMRQIVLLEGSAVVAHFDVPGLMAFRHIVGEPDGSLWIVRGFGNVTDQPLCHVTRAGVTCFGQDQGLPIPTAFALLSDNDGSFWIGGQRALIHWRHGISTVHPIEALKANQDIGVDALARDHEGTLWVGVQAGPGLGLGKLINGVVQPFVRPGFDGRDVVVLALTVDRQGSLWVGTLGKGLFRIRGDVVERYQRTDGLSSDNVHDVFEDREGNRWALTSSGIDVFREPRITTYAASEGLGPAAAGVMASRDGTIWVANNGSLDRITNGRVSSIGRGQGLPGVQVTSLLQDSTGNIWVGVDSGLYLFKDGQFRPVTAPGGEPLGMISGMTEDVGGDIWAVCAGRLRQLVRIRDFQVREQFPAPQTPFGHVLAPHPNDGIWISTTENWDLLHFRAGHFTRFALKLSPVPVFHFYAASDGSVVVASVDGLVVVRDGRVQRLTTVNGLPCNSVVSAILDQQKHWWLFTDCGVVEFSDDELQRWWHQPETSVERRVFDVRDGARPQGRPSFNAAALAPDGRVWFATGLLVQVIDPRILSQSAPPVDAYVESLIVDRRPVTTPADAPLASHPREVQIDYTSPSFTAPDKVHFRYRLDGHDAEWREAGTRRQAFYTDLPPGNYTFRVIAANSDGIWSARAATLNFSIAPAYYQTRWFRGLALAALIAVAWGTHRVRIKRIQQRFELTLDARVAERTRIARDLHDTLLQSFHGLLLRFQTAAFLLPDRPVEAKEHLESAIQNAASAITEGRDAVQGLRASTVERNDLARAIRTLGDELAAQSTAPQPARLDVEVAGEPRDLHPIVRDEIYKIAGEALRNAFRHAHARSVEVEAHYGEEEFRLCVRDDGRGIDPALLATDGVEGHYGLRGLPERAAVIGGQVAVWSQTGAGTEVELRLPARGVYAGYRRRRWWWSRERARRPQ